MPDKPFIHEDFMLETAHARRLYHEVAADIPIIDFHCHLPPDQIAEDRRFRNLTEIWLGGDHYKWRAMRSNGVDEQYCTGNAPDRDKFQKWAETAPNTLRNPLYHWTHLELKRPFGIGDRLLSPATAQSIWDDCNVKLATPQFSCRGIMRQMNVRIACTTDDPADSLEHHAKIREAADFDIQVLPTWRPDKAMDVDGTAGYNPTGYLPYLDRLSAAANVEIKDYAAFWEALGRRLEFFISMGCRVSDHGPETIFAETPTEAEAAAIFAKIRARKNATAAEVLALKSDMLYRLALMDHAAGIRQQFHFGAIRNNNSRLYKKLGPDQGFDSIGDFAHAKPLSRFLNRLDSENRLAPTILYNLNPRDNELAATMLGNFQDGSMPGKIQMGSAWWFMDQLDGMTRQIEALSNMGLLGRFVGMITDSRSFLSYTRHEYFRRLLCNILGNDIQKGLIPDEPELTDPLVRNICYNNAVEFFGFNSPRIGE